MFYMKGDDMEEMFRKAADGYELNEEMAADWNKVHTALQDEVTAVIPAKKEKKRRKYFFVWIFLATGLISLFTYKTVFYFSNKNQNAKSELPVKLNADTKEDAKNDQIKTANESKNVSATVLNSTTLTNNIKKLPLKSDFILTGTHLASNIKDNVNDNKELIVIDSNNTLQYDNVIAHSESRTNIHQPGNENIADSNFSSHNASNKNLSENESIAGLENKTNTSQQNKSQQKNKKNNYTRQSFVYASFLGNADISFVKFQKASAPGYGLGIMGGYHFKSGISLETGLLYDKKNYYTKGEYFDTKSLPYLQYVNLISANGNCNMWEIPVNIKYDFNTQKKYSFFVMAGFSSYLMNKEFYNFKYEKNGVQGERGYDYYHSSQNWFSVLNLGGGINIKTGNRYFLQVQPYYKVPISGVGKGNLSLSSAGINLSVTRRFK